MQCRVAVDATEVSFKKYQSELNQEAIVEEDTLDLKGQFVTHLSYLVHFEAKAQPTAGQRCPTPWAPVQPTAGQRCPIPWAPVNDKFKGKGAINDIGGTVTEVNVLFKNSRPEPTARTMNMKGLLDVIRVVVRPLLCRAPP